MRLPKPLWLSIALAGVVGASGFVWIPVPLGLVEDALAEREPGFQLGGYASLRWASGEVRAQGLRFAWSGRELATADYVSVDLDLRPWSETFAEVWRVQVYGFSAELDPNAATALSRLQQEPSDPVSIEVVLEEGYLAWTQADGERFSGHLSGARVLIRTGAAEQAESAGEAEFLLDTPTAIEARLRFRAVDGGAIEASVVAQGQRLQELAARFPAVAELGGSIAAEAHLHLGDFGNGERIARIRLSTAAPSLSHPALPAALKGARFAANGDLLSALEWSAAVDSPHGRLAADGRLHASSPPTDGLGIWTGEAQARLDGCAIDAELEQQLAAQVPEALEILAALGLRGVASARAGFRGSFDAAGLQDGWELAVAAPVQGLGLDYAGFESKDGSRFSFPYPLAVTSGIAGWSDGAVLVVAEALAGEARRDPHGEIQEPMRIGARCAVSIDEAGAEVWLDLAARSVRLDDRIGAALQANPETGPLWYQLGAPRGEADVDVALRPATGGETAWSVRLDGRNLTAEPPDAGLLLEIPKVSARIGADGVEFTADARTGAAQLQATGRVRAIAGREGANDLACVVSGVGYLTAEERERLAVVRGLPPEFVEIELGGTPEWTVNVRTVFEGQNSPPLRLLADAVVRDAAPSWPSHNQSGSGWSLRAAAVLTPDEVLIAIAPAEGQWKDTRLQVGGAAWLPTVPDPAAPPMRGTLTASLFESAISQDEVQAALLLINADAWTTGLRFTGNVSATVELPLADPSALRARLNLNPLRVQVQPGALGATAMAEPARYALTGALRLLDGAVTTQRLSLRGDELDLVLEETGGRLDETGLSMSGVAVSQRGVHLRTHLGVVAPPRVLASLDRIGLNGRIAPQRVLFDVQWPAGGTPRATASGTLALSEFDVDGPPPVLGGAGSVICEEFIWNGPEDFHGDFRLENGTAVVSGIHLHDARATVSLKSDRVLVTDFEAAALDGRVFTQLVDTDGNPHAGLFSLGLAGRAAVRADFGFEGFLLERMGEELGYRGPLAGRLDGRVDVRSADPSPVNYRGSVRLHITDGILGAVPVLSQIWQLLGVEAPVFREGRLSMQFLSEGRILIEELALMHALLEVTGERIITMDSYLALKVTVRTFGLLGRLPLIRDLMDLIVEQDVYGPASTPRLRQRGIGKLFQGDPERVNFPLWVPRTPLPDRLRSPILPEGRVLAPRS